MKRWRPPNREVSKLLLKILQKIPKEKKGEAITAFWKGYNKRGR